MFIFINLLLCLRTDILKNMNDIDVWSKQKFVQMFNISVGLLDQSSETSLLEVFWEPAASLKSRHKETFIVPFLLQFISSNMFIDAKFL